MVTSVRTWANYNECTGAELALFNTAHSRRQPRPEVRALARVSNDGHRRDCAYSRSKVWNPGHFAVIKAADPLVGRVCVNAAIKKALCREAGSDRAWLEKVRPVVGHDYHFHVRLRCRATAPKSSSAKQPHRDLCSKPKATR
jgi:murein endopeptidase